jgi:hypothetical protein
LLVGGEGLVSGRLIVRRPTWESTDVGVSEGELDCGLARGLTGEWDEGAQARLADVGRDGCGACVRGRRGCCAGGVGLCVRRGAHDRTVEVVVHEMNLQRM